MIIRRYYPKGWNGQTYSEDFLAYREGRGDNITFDNARMELLLSPEEQKTFYAECCERILTQTRYVLDNLEKLPEFKVSWEDYHRKGYWKRKVYKENNTE